MYSDAAGKFAVLAKTTRNATIGFVVLGYALYWARKSQARQIANKAAFLWQKFPKFVLGFILISLLATLGVFNKAQITDLANLSRWAFLLTLAGVGLRTNLGEMRKQGLRPFIVGAVGEFAIAGIYAGSTGGLAAGARRYVVDRHGRRREFEIAPIQKNGLAARALWNVLPQVSRKRLQRHPTPISSSVERANLPADSSLSSTRPLKAVNLQQLRIPRERYRHRRRGNPANGFPDGSPNALLRSTNVSSDCRAAELCECTTLDAVFHRE
jgi:hypothetical protein